MRISIPLSGIVTATLGLTVAEVSSLPNVDLGYAVYQATHNSSGVNSYYNFSNIRYAQNPTGNLRFAPPLPPSGRNATVNDGQQGVVCSNVYPAWTSYVTDFLSTYLTSGNVSGYATAAFYEEVTTPIPFSDLPLSEPGTSEDCLFLDVIVPKLIYDNQGPYSVECEFGKPCKEAAEKGAPVLVWIYGGGFTEGSKASSGSAAGIIARSLQNNTEGVIFVAMNYRLGLFGWLAGDNDVTPNVGLLDQRLALEWVQQNIFLFGGDATRVTVIGESAGASSIMHHITSYGGEGTIPFHQAIPQSPAFQVLVPSQQTELFNDVLKVTSTITNTSITTVSELRNLPFTVLELVNSYLVTNSMYGSFTFGPVIDTRPFSYVPDIPARLLAEGKFHNVSITVGHNSNEGLLFTPPYVQTQALFNTKLASLLPSANASTLSYIDNVLYPPVYDGSYGYLNPIGRTDQFLSDFIAGCNAIALDSALETGPSYAYYFSVAPGIHGEDVPYTFFNGDTSTLDEGYPVFATVAEVLQRYLTEFAISGVPRADNYGVLAFLKYGSNDTSTNINYANLGARIKDPAVRSACSFWNSAPYYPKS